MKKLAKIAILTFVLVSIGWCCGSVYNRHRTNPESISGWTSSEADADTDGDTDGDTDADTDSDADANNDTNRNDSSRCKMQSNIVPASRLGNWCEAGVQGGIPNYPIGVNVLDYGAVGDGKTDDTNAILAAIAACPVKSAVLLPAGAYYTKKTIVIAKSVVLRGEGPNVTQITQDFNGIGISLTSGGNWAGVEDLHYKTVYPLSRQRGTKIQFEKVQNSWVKNIETSGYSGIAVRLFRSCSHCEVRDSYMHNSQEETTALDLFSAYGITIDNGDNTYNLVENNVLDWFRHAMLIQYRASHNVFAYNFAWNNWTTVGGLSASIDMEFHHYDYSEDPPTQFTYYTLVEGNLFEQGGSGQRQHQFNTYLRNRVNNGGITLYTNNHAIGNELVEKKNPGTWNPGLVEDNSVRKIEEGSIVHGNYVTVPAKGLSWDPSIADHNIPNSYYLTSKPAFFGDLDWPPYGGDLMPGNKRRNPAEVRYWTMLYPEKSPSNLQADVSVNKIVLTWNNNSTNKVDFIICRSMDNVNFQRIGYTYETSYTDTVAKTGRYHYYVRARNHLGGRNTQGKLNGIDLGGESEPSETLTVETE